MLAHCIDTAIWLNGTIKDVSAVTETFVKERVHALTGQKQPVGIDDACSFFCHFNNGSLGLFESTRYARGHKALYTLEINGEHASIAWDLHDLHRLKYFDHSASPLFAVGEVYTCPMATNRIWVIGGSLVFKSDTSIRSFTKLRTSSRVSKRVSQLTQASATHSKPKGLRRRASERCKPPMG